MEQAKFQMRNIKIEMFGREVWPLSLLMQFINELSFFSPHPPSYFFSTSKDAKLSPFLRRLERRNLSRLPDCVFFFFFFLTRINLETLSLIFSFRFWPFNIGIVHKIVNDPSLFISFVQFFFAALPFAYPINLWPGIIQSLCEKWCNTWPTWKEHHRVDKRDRVHVVQPNPNIIGGASWRRVTVD